jgi:trimeric autotransporter adhesin
MSTVGLIASRGGVQRLELVGARTGWVRRAVAVVVVVFGCAAALVALSNSAAQHAAGTRRGLASLPAAAQGPISAALGRKERVYRVVGLHARNPVQRLRVGFSRAGVAIDSGGARFGIALSAYGYSSALRPLAFVAPVASANRVSYARGAVSEWYANGPLGVEQGFDVAARPHGGTGPLTFSLALSGNLAGKLDHGSLLLARKGVALRYGGLVAADARGRALRSWLELIGGRVLIRVDDRGAVYPLHVDPFVQQAELTAGDGAASDLLGASVAVSGDTVVAGSYNHNSGKGAVYVFVMPAAGWANATQTAELTATDGAPGDNLGASVAVSGNTIVAGAPHHMVGANANQGAGYVFVMPASGWAGSVSTQTADLTATDGASGDLLGRSVAISGDTVIAGAPNRASFSAGTGGAYVFVRPAPGWAGTVPQTGVLIAADGATGDRLGVSVAVSGDTVITGAPSHQVGSNARQGAVYVFVMPASGWAGGHLQTAELTAIDGASGDLLGSFVAVSGDTVVAGAANHTVGLNAQQGAAYVFVMPASGWAGSLTATAELTASDGAAADLLAGPVAISGNTVIASASGHTVGANANQGAAYVFVMPASGWAGSLTQTAELTASDGVTNDGQSGFSVAVSGSTVILGVPGHRVVGTNPGPGAAYVFLVPPSIVLASPTNGATYTQGEAVTAAYSCTAPAGATVTTCAGPVANGAPIDTETLGSHTLTVNAKDSDGARATQSASYTVVVALASPANGAAPVLSGVSESAKTWRENNTLPHISANKKKRPPIGTTFSFRLNERATVSFSFTQQTAGRKVHGKCVAQTKRNRHKPRCTRVIIVGTLTFTAHQGVNKVRFAGRISPHKKLKRGRYTLVITATNPARQRSAPRSLTFTIVK